MFALLNKKLPWPAALDTPGAIAAVFSFGATTVAVTGAWLFIG